MTLALVWVLTITVTYFIINNTNPLPGIVEAFSKFSELSRPSARWTEQLGDPPSAAVVAGDAVVVVSREAVEARSLATGVVLWDRTTAWSAVAGDEAAAVVVVGARGGGIEVLDPRAGTVRWRDPEGVAAWTFRTAVLTLTCPATGGCAVVARAPADGAQRWRTQVPGLGRGDRGVNRQLVLPRDVTARYPAAVGAQPRVLPAVLGLAVGRKVEMIDTASGRRASALTPSGSVSVTLVGGRAVSTTTTPQGRSCGYGIDATVPATGAVAWHRDGYDPHTVTGAGCEEHRAPTGAAGALVVTRTDRREALLAGADGREVRVAAPGESVRSIGERTARVRSADAATIRAVDTASGKQRWSQPLPERAAVTVLRHAVLVLDEDTARLFAYDQDTGRRLLDARILGEVIGSGPTGLILARGRTIGFVAWS